MWWASLASPQPLSTTAASPGSSSAKAAASPIDKPWRAASPGRHGSGEVSSSEAKPYSVVRHSESTPPTTAASARPAAISRSAAANALADDEQAVEMANAGPRTPSSSRTKATSEPVLCVRA